MGKLSCTVKGDAESMQPIGFGERGIMLMAENNAEYDPMIYEREEAANVRILGEAVAIIRAV